MTEFAASDSKLRTGRRSPSFPFIPLGRAIERARSLATDYKRTPTRLSNAAQTWGYKPKSSGCLQTIAALKAFGLIEDVGTGDDRKVQLTDLAWRIVHDQRPGVRENALQDAALRPKLIAEFAHGAWRGGRPADHHCISELTIDRGFTEDAARTFLKVFRTQSPIPAYMNLTSCLIRGLRLLRQKLLMSLPTGRRSAPVILRSAVVGQCSHPFQLRKGSFCMASSEEESNIGS